MKTLKFAKIRCGDCKNVILIPMFERFSVNGPLTCEECGRTVVIKNR